MRFGITIPAIPAVVAGAMLMLTATQEVTAGDYGAKKDKVAASADAKQDIVATAVAAGNFKTLAAALEAAGLVDALKGEGPFTVFAPTDEAFAKLPEGTLQELLKPENKQKLADILKFHVVSGKAKAADVVGKDAWETLEGERILITKAGDKVQVENATITATDIKASNGVIHVIDTVILPDQPQSVINTARKAGSFETLVTALRATGLDSALAAEGPFTVFAPTDEAFAKLPAGTLDNLLKPENKDQLANILKYHVVSGKVTAEQAQKLDKAETLAGKSFNIQADGGRVKVDEATVAQADVNASNGVIHVIDTVIIPAS